MWEDLHLVTTMIREILRLYFRCLDKKILFKWVPEQILSLKSSSVCSAHHWKSSLWLKLRRQACILLIKVAKRNTRLSKERWGAWILTQHFRRFYAFSTGVCDLIMQKGWRNGQSQFYILFRPYSFSKDQRKFLNIPGWHKWGLLRCKEHQTAANEQCTCTRILMIYLGRALRRIRSSGWTSLASEFTSKCWQDGCFVGKGGSFPFALNSKSQQRATCTPLIHSCIPCHLYTLVSERCRHSQFWIFRQWNLKLFPRSWIWWDSWCRSSPRWVWQLVQSGLMLHFRWFAQFAFDSKWKDLLKLPLFFANSSHPFPSISLRVLLKLFLLQSLSCESVLHKLELPVSPCARRMRHFSCSPLFMASLEPNFICRLLSLASLGIFSLALCLWLIVKRITFISLESSVFSGSRFPRCFRLFSLLFGLHFRFAHQSSLIVSSLGFCGFWVLGFWGFGVVGNATFEWRCPLVAWLIEIYFEDSSWKTGILSGRNKFQVTASKFRVNFSSQVEILLTSGLIRH